jgi:hypothetical protein
MFIEAMVGNLLDKANVSLPDPLGMVGDMIDKVLSEAESSFYY